MDQELWQKVATIFDAALERPRNERLPYVQACADSETTLNEVLRLLKEFDNSEGFLDSPLLRAPQALASGDRIADRYQIESLIGRGGMGEVYRAQDLVLGETIALKTLRSDFSGNPDLIRRFQSEIRLARKVTHANVCRVFETGVHAIGDRQVQFFTMQLVEGETLAERIRRNGPLPRNEAIAILLQIADGLEAAHQAGVIHRDLKSSNILLSNNKAVITDFGLARLGEPSGSVGDAEQTATTNVTGTIAYMSPEQLSGGEITARSDIYALGVVLFEMVTGRRPFDDQHIIQSAMQRVAESTTRLRSIAPGLDPHLARIIGRCLQPDPEKRFHSAAELKQKLHPGVVRDWLLRARNKRGPTLAIAGIGLCVLAVSLWVLISRYSTQELDAGAKIMVTPVENTTGDARFDGVTTALLASAGQSARFNLWENGRLSTVLQSMRREPASAPSSRDWREIAFREGTPLLVFSSLGRIGDRFILTLQAERIGAAPDPPAQTWNTSIPISGPEQMFEGVRQAAHWIRATAGESELELSGHDRLPQNITSASWEALQLYQEAQELNQSGKPAESIPFYRRAIAEDSSFAMALMRLGDTLVSQRDSKEGFNFWRQAIDAGRAQRLDERERLNLESRYALETADYPKAEPILREWVRKYPNDPRPSEWLVATLRGLGRDEDAVAEAKKRTERFGPSLFSIGHLIHALGTTGRLDEIPAYFQVLEQLNAKGVALRFRGILAAVRGNHPEAEQYFHSYESVAKGAEASQARALLATLAAEHGDYPRAIDLLRNGMDLDRQGGMIGLAAAKASGIAYLKLLQNNRAESEEWAHEALALQSSPQIVMQVVTILARNGKTEAAARVLKQMPAGEGPGHNARVARARGELSLARGDIEGGLSLLELAAATEGATRPKGYLARALELAHQQTRANDALYVRQSPWISWTWPEVEWPAGNHNTRQ